MEKCKDALRYLLAIVVLAMIFATGCGNNVNTDSTKTDRTENISKSVSETTTKVKTKTNKATDRTKKSDKNSKSKNNGKTSSKTVKISSQMVDVDNLPNYSGKAYVAINGNKPDFSKKEITDKSFESYSKLDSLGRCQVAEASVGKDIMPTEKRGAIGSVKPTGWQTIKYSFVEGKYLYNRCHLIGYQLTGENANNRNLITGTRYLNIEGMLPFEDMVADYVKETNNHVMYRVTPVFKGNELLARGVQMEGYSVEDKGAGVSFNVYCYNVQPGVKITYKTGSSISTGKYANKETTKRVTETTKKSSGGSSSSSGKVEYILNMNTHKFHYPSCRSVKQMSEANKGYYKGTRDDVISQGYDPCGICNP